MSSSSSREFRVRGRLILAGGMLIVAVMFVPRVRADLLAYWDMNDVEDDSVLLDRSGNDNDGDITSFNEAFDTDDPAWDGIPEYTEDGGGVTGLPGDRALDFGPARNGAIVNLPTVADGEFDSIVENDAFTVAFWAFGGDDLPQDTVVFAFYHDPDQFPGDQRMISVHLPWSNSNIIYDTGGCCLGENRISQAAEESEFKGQWNHYAFLKDADRTAIYLNGELWLEGFGKRPMNPFFTGMLGGGRRGGNPLQGDITWGGLLDEFRVYDEALEEEEIQELMTPDENPMPPAGASLKPGDTNGDGLFNLSDPVANLSFLFGGGDGESIPDCYRMPDAAALSEAGMAVVDFNDDGKNDLTDAVGALSFLFSGGPPHVLGVDCVSIEGACEDSCQG